MITGIYQALLMLLGLVPFYITDSYFHRKYDPQREQGKTGRNWWIVGGSLVVAAVIFLQPILWPGLSFYTDAWWGLALQLAGMLLLLAAAALNYWARTHLGVFYVQGSVVQENHQLIESGPYAYVRHPLFSAYFLIAFGLLFCNPSLVTLLLVVGLFFYLNMWTRRDETVLARELPGYEAYMTRTNRFVPALSAIQRRRRSQ